MVGECDCRDRSDGKDGAICNGILNLPFDVVQLVTKVVQAPTLLQLAPHRRIRRRGFDQLHQVGLFIALKLDADLLNRVVEDLRILC